MERAQFTTSDNSEQTMTKVLSTIEKSKKTFFGESKYFKLMKV